MSSLTIAEVLDALAQAAGPQERPPHTYSGTEIMDGLRWGYPRFAKQMRAWLADGTASVVTYQKAALNGRMATVRGYRFTAPVLKRKRA